MKSRKVIEDTTCPDELPNVSSTKVDAKAVIKNKPVLQHKDEEYKMDDALLHKIMDKIGEHKKGKKHYTEYRLWWKLVCVYSKIFYVIWYK